MTRSRNTFRNARKIKTGAAALASFQRPASCATNSGSGEDAPRGLTNALQHWSIPRARGQRRRVVDRSCARQACCQGVWACTWAPLLRTLAEASLPEHTNRPTTIRLPKPTLDATDEEPPLPTYIQK